MASVLKQLRPDSKIYWDRRTFPTYDDAKNALENSDTVYIGNLTFYASESQIKDFFSCCGEVRCIKMGLNRISRTPCGFAFVQFYNHRAAVCAVDLLNGAKFDDRFIKVEIDPGFKEGREWGRGKTGGQASDDFRSNYDFDRGGWGERKPDTRGKRGKRRNFSRGADHSRSGAKKRKRS